MKTGLSVCCLCVIVSCRFAPESHDLTSVTLCCSIFQPSTNFVFCYLASITAFSLQPLRVLGNTVNTGNQKCKVRFFFFKMHLTLTWQNLFPIEWNIFQPICRMALHVGDTIKLITTSTVYELMQQSSYFSLMIVFSVEISTDSSLICLNLICYCMLLFYKDKPAEGQWVCCCWNKAIYFCLNVQDKQSSMIWQTMGTGPLQKQQLLLAIMGMNFIFMSSSLPPLTPCVSPVSCVCHNLLVCMLYAC